MLVLGALHHPGKAYQGLAKVTDLDLRTGRQQVGLIRIGTVAVLATQFVGQHQGLGTIASGERVEHQAIGGARGLVARLDALLPPTPTCQGAESEQDAEDDPESVLAQPLLDAFPLFLLVVVIIDHGLCSPTPQG